MNWAWAGIKLDRDHFQLREIPTDMTSEIFREIGNYCLTFDPHEVDVLLGYLEEAYHERKAIYIFGNGGSAVTASHFCQDLSKGTLLSPSDPHRFKVFSLTDNTPYLMAWANDEGYETIFEQPLRNLAEPGDLAIGISCSGNSENVLRAIRYAQAAGLLTIGMTGFDGGQLKKIVNHCIHIPIHDIGMVESMHLIIVHYIVSSLKNRLYE
jgi:D-sedoheptulose 7-phosphate isomerase